MKIKIKLKIKIENETGQYIQIDSAEMSEKELEQMFETIKKSIPALSPEYKYRKCSKEECQNEFGGTGEFPLYCPDHNVFNNQAKPHSLI